MIGTRLVRGEMLRCGYTTGSSAAAAAKAAATMLLTKERTESVVLTTPAGSSLTLDILEIVFGDGFVSCAVKKDGGDDPDITNGSLIYARADLTPEGFLLKGGEGVGVVTKPGLDQPVGAHAINSVPRRMIEENCRLVCRQHGYTGGLAVTISIPGGEELAQRTFNPRIGIEGGLSILGTTGIVEPMSQKAIVDTIRRELSVLSAAGQQDLLLTIGNYGASFAREQLGLSTDNSVKCSNFIGESLSAAAELGFKRVKLIGHIGKLVKLGIGITNTHSNYGDGRMETLIACALSAGAGIETLHRIQQCISVDAALDILEQAEILNQTICVLQARIAETIRRHVAENLEVQLICFRGMGKASREVFSI